MKCLTPHGITGLEKVKERENIGVYFGPSLTLTGHNDSVSHLETHHRTGSNTASKHVAKF
jgi:hypothetical protein